MQLGPSRQIKSHSNQHMAGEESCLLEYLLVCHLKYDSLPQRLSEMAEKHNLTSKKNDKASMTSGEKCTRGNIYEYQPNCSYKLRQLFFSVKKAHHNNREHKLKDQQYKRSNVLHKLLKCKKNTQFWTYENLKQGLNETQWATFLNRFKKWKDRVKKLLKALQLPFGTTAAVLGQQILPRTYGNANQ